ncbi:MAG TPA: DUF4245 domain-containing protein [Micromonosporaceae bacterium]|nr:DUF4245 domain-containing protein [Micromonosporaceae bacterium]
MTEPPATPPSGSDRPRPLSGAALRLSRTPGDMVKAVLVLLVPVVAAVLVYVYFFGGSNVIAIDPSTDYANARADGHFTVVQPAGLPDGWKPVSSAFSRSAEGAVLRVGYIAPDGGGIQLIESDRPAGKLLDDELGPTNTLATSVDIGGLTWGQLDSTKRNDHALVSTQDGRTLIVHGQASQEDLREFAASLR